jgi:hypothetical protein
MTARFYVMNSIFYVIIAFFYMINHSFYVINHFSVRNRSSLDGILAYLSSQKKKETDITLLLPLLFQRIIRIQTVPDRIPEDHQSFRQVQRISLEYPVRGGSLERFRL